MQFFVREEDLEELEIRESIPQIMTTREVQRLLGIGKNSMYKLLATKQLKGFRIGRDWRVSRSSVMEFIG
jgi:excisionase family DNA binding protein